MGRLRQHLRSLIADGIAGQSERVQPVEVGGCRQGSRAGRPDAVVRQVQNAQLGQPGRCREGFCSAVAEAGVARISFSQQQPAQPAGVSRSGKGTGFLRAEAGSVKQAFESGQGSRSDQRLDPGRADLAVEIEHPEPPQVRRAGQSLHPAGRRAQGQLFELGQVGRTSQGSDVLAADPVSEVQRSKVGQDSRLRDRSRDRMELAMEEIERLQPGQVGALRETARSFAAEVEISELDGPEPGQPRAGKQVVQGRRRSNQTDEAHLPQRGACEQPGRLLQKLLDGQGEPFDESVVVDGVAASANLGLEPRVESLAQHPLSIDPGAEGWIIGVRAGEADLQADQLGSVDGALLGVAVFFQPVGVGQSGDDVVRVFADGGKQRGGIAHGGLR
jgi:hypothetical protein